MRQYLQCPDCASAGDTAAGDVTVALLEHCARRESPMLLLPLDEPEMKKNMFRLHDRVTV